MGQIRKPFDRTTVRSRTLPAVLQPETDVLSESPAEALETFLLELCAKQKITGGELAKYTSAVRSLAGRRPAAAWKLTKTATTTTAATRTDDDDDDDAASSSSRGSRLAPFGFGVGVDDLKCFETLDFDAYATPLRSIPLLMVRGLQCKDLDCDEAKAIQWIFQIRDHYNDANPYHNWRHAWDVYQFCAVLAGALAEPLPAADRFALLLAAVAHDVGHPGVTNAHLVMRSAPLAIMYNDRSVLENFHASVAFGAMRGPRDFMPTALHKEVRGKMIRAILATDMAGHAGHIKALSCEEGPGVGVVMDAVLHMGDIGGCCREWETQLRLGAMLEEEFFRQGDEEARRGLPVQPLMNRSRDSFAVGQGFWIPKIVLPLVKALQPLVDGVGAAMEEQCTAAEARWAQMVNKHGDVTAGEIAFRELGFRVPEGCGGLDLSMRGLVAPWA
jgi:hypothetical protein